MGTKLTTELTTAAASLLNDPTNIRFSVPELLGWLNEGIRKICSVIPGAYTKNISQICVAGTEQTLPSDCKVLLRIPRNKGTSGTTDGPAITQVPQSVLDVLVVNGVYGGWHQATANNVAQHFVYNKDTPNKFYLYPPQPSSSPGYVQIQYLATPTDLTSGQAIPIDDTYASDLIDYQVFRANLKETDVSDVNVAISFEKRFIDSITAKYAAAQASGDKP